MNSIQNMLVDAKVAAAKAADAEKIALDAAKAAKADVDAHPGDAAKVSALDVAKRTADEAKNLADKEWAKVRDLEAAEADAEEKEKTVGRYKMAAIVATFVVAIVLVVFMMRSGAQIDVSSAGLVPTVSKTDKVEEKKDETKPSAAADSSKTDKVEEKQEELKSGVLQSEAPKESLGNYVLNDKLEKLYAGFNAKVEDDNGKFAVAADLLMGLDRDKANTADVYTKTEVDTLLGAKAAKSDLDALTKRLENSYATRAESDVTFAAKQRSIDRLHARLKGLEGRQRATHAIDNATNVAREGVGFTDGPNGPVPVN